MCSGMTWTAPHERWSRRQRFDDTHAGSAFDHHFNAVLTTTAARDLLDEQIVAVVAAPRWADTVDRLRCLRSISRGPISVGYVTHPASQGALVIVWL